MSAVSCDDARALLDLEPLDLLEAAQVAALDGHAAACPACAREREGLRAAHAALRADTAGALARPLPEGARGRALDAALITDEEAGVGTKKGTVIDGPTVDAARVEAVGRRIALGCSYCHARTAREEVVFCASCLAPHHAECFRAHGRCSLPGCEETKTVRPGATAAPPARRRVRIPFVAGLGLAGVVAAWSVGQRHLMYRIALEEGYIQSSYDGHRPVARSGPGGRVNVELRDVDLREAVDLLAQETNRNLIVDPAVRERVTLALRDVPVLDALQALARQARCRVERVGEVWALSQPPKVTLQFTDANVRTVLQLLAAYSGKNLLIGPEVRGSVTQDFKGVDWDTGLIAICHAVGTRAWAVGEDLIYVGETPPPGATGFEPGARVLASKGPEAADAAPIDVALDGATPAEACARVAAAAGRAIELRGAPDPDRRVTLRLRATPWPSVLAMVAKAADCDVEPVPGGAIVRPVPRLKLVRTRPIRLGALLKILADVEREAGRSFDMAIPPDVAARRAAVDLEGVRPRDALTAWAQVAGCEVTGDSSHPSIAAVRSAAPTREVSDPRVGELRLEAVVLGRRAWAVIGDEAYEVGQPLLDPETGDALKGSLILSITESGVRLDMPTGELVLEAPARRRE